MNFYNKLISAGIDHDEAVRYYVHNEQQRIENAEEAQRRSYEYTETMDGRYPSTEDYE